MCKRNSPDKNEASTGCVIETPQIKMNPAQDVWENSPIYPKKKKKKKKKKKPKRDV